MSSITFGPLQGAGPSVGGGLLAIGTGVFGLIYISFNLLAGKGKSVSRWKIAFGFCGFTGFRSQRDRAGARGSLTKNPPAYIVNCRYFETTTAHRSSGACFTFVI